MILVLISFCTTKKAEESIPFSTSYLKDETASETIQSIKEKEFLVVENPRLGFENGLYWFKIVLNAKTANKAIIFDLPESNIDTITVYRNTTIVPYKELVNTHASLLINSELENEIYYLKVHFNNEVFFPLAVKYHKKSQLKEKYSFFVNGLYYGFVLMILITNIFFYFSLSDKTFLFYCFFLIAINIGVLGYDGLLSTLLPSSLYSNYSYLIHFLVPLCGALFANHFLNINYYLPNSNKIAIYLLFIALCCYLLFIPFNAYVFVAIANTVSLLVLLHYWIIGVIILKKHEFARFFVIGYSLVLFSAFLFIIPLDWGLNSYVVSLNVIKIGALFETLILTYAITYRIKILHKENEKFRSEIDEYLKEIEVLQLKNKDSFELEEELLKSKYDLSSREIEVLLLIYKGYTNKRIGEELYVSLNTVKYHIRNIYEKLNIKNKNQAIDVFSTIKNI